MQKSLITLLHNEKNFFAINRNFSDTFVKTAFISFMKKLWGTSYLLEIITWIHHFGALSRKISCLRQKFHARFVKTDYWWPERIFEENSFVWKVFFFFFFFQPYAKSFRPSGTNFLTMSSELHSSIPAEPFAEDYLFYAKKVNFYSQSSFEEKIFCFICKTFEPELSKLHTRWPKDYFE